MNPMSQEEADKIIQYLLDNKDIMYLETRYPVLGKYNVIVKQHLNGIWECRVGSSVMGEWDHTRITATGNTFSTSILHMVEKLKSLGTNHTQSILMVRVDERELKELVTYIGEAYGSNEVEFRVINETDSMWISVASSGIEV